MLDGVPSGPSALGHLRICDFTGQLAGAGATRFMAAFGAQVIRIEDPTNQGRWDILRQMGPFKDHKPGTDRSISFNNHNVEKLGITLNLRTASARRALEDLIAVSDVVSENFAAGVMERLGFGYERLRQIRPDIVYVSNCGFGHTGPYKQYKTWGPSVQAFSGLTFQSGLPDQPPAGWGYSYMDHTGAYYMAIAIMAALFHRERTGEGQWVDMATTEVAATLNGPALLDYTINGRPLRRPGMPNSNRDQGLELGHLMVPHGVYPANGEDRWVAIACRDQHDWECMCSALDLPWMKEKRFQTLEGRAEHEDELDALIADWTGRAEAREIAQLLQEHGVPASAVVSPEERIDHDVNTAAWGLWPEAQHTELGGVRVDGQPVHLSETDWTIERGAACLGEHNGCVLGEILGYSTPAIGVMQQSGAI